MESKRFYTGRGDQGYTDLLGARIPKHHPVTELIGALDETTSQLGMARALAKSERTKTVLLEIQRDLYKMMAELAFTSDELANAYRTTAEDLARLESMTDEIVGDVEIAREFIVPGDTVSGAALDVARVVTRRTERLATRMAHAANLRNDVLLAYLNRLSSLLFVLGRLEEQEEGVRPTKAKLSD